MSFIARKQQGVPGRLAESRGPGDGRTKRSPFATAQQSEIVTSERIQRRAYEIFCARNKTGRAGDQISDWLEAEREVRSAAPDPGVASEVELKNRARGDALLVQDD